MHNLAHMNDGKTLTTAPNGMVFQTHNEGLQFTGGTSLQGYIDISYERLVQMLGQPEAGDEYKVDAEWIVRFDDGTVATIYNWKDGKNYNGDEGLDVEQITDWHIGGFNNMAVFKVNQLFGLA